MRMIKERWPRHDVVIAFDNDIAGFSSMKKLIETDRASKFFVWFNGGTREKDINEAVISSGNPRMFTDEHELDNMVYDSL